MKKVIFSLALLLTCSLLGYAQKGISYQAIILDPKPIEIPGQNITGQPLVNGQVSLKFRIYSANLIQEFEEVHTTQTDAYGTVNVLIGSQNAAAFSALVWDSKQKSLHVLVSFDQGGTYTKVSEQQLTYNPMALFAETAGKLSETLSIAGGGTGATTAAAARTNLGLGNVDNTSDAAKPISIATQNALDAKANAAEVNTALATKANASEVTTSLGLKEDVSNKANTPLGTSTTLYPTQNAVKTYVDAQMAGATIVDADASTKGKIQLAGDLGGTASLPTVPGLAAKADAAAVNTALNLKANAADVTTALATKANAADVTTALSLKETTDNKSISVLTDGGSDNKYPTVKSVKTYVDAQIAGATIADANGSTKGKIQLAGDLAGTAASPTVPGLVAKADAAAVTTALAQKAPLASPAFTGTVAVGTASPSPAAVLDLTSTSKGLLLPRLTFVQRSAIVSPEAGLILWCTDCGENGDGELQVYNGTNFVNMVGANVQFILPTISATSAATAITSSSFTTGGSIGSDGGALVTARGVVWNTSTNPTILLSTKTTDGTGIGNFSSSVTGLTSAVTYYVRAYATNSVGTKYGPEITVNSAQAVATLATTTDASSITTTSASSGGNITYNGGATVTASGVVWSTSASPTVALSTKTTDGAADGTFSSSITGLSPGTLYYVRSYATNSVGTSYGEQISFTTLTTPTLAATTAASSIAVTTATSGGDISSDGGSAVTARGIVWGTTTNPTTALTTKTTDGTGTGTFTSNLTGLTAATTYYVRSYATNAIGTVYGAETSFTTATPYVAPTVIIGTQQWMSQNLDIETYRNGDVIPQVTDPAAWSNLTTGAWCYYDNDPANGAIYGKLYNWYAVTDPRGLAPQGWHISTGAEWTTLKTFLGGDAAANNKMMTTGSPWNPINANATNESGFSGLPGGVRDSSGSPFYRIGSHGYWWTADNGYRSISSVEGFYSTSSGNPGYGFSVRLVNDEAAPFQAPPIVTNGLLLNLDAANPASYLGSGTTWNDLSGNNNHGTLAANNSGSLPVFQDGSLYFNGSTSYVSIASSVIPNTGSWTLSTWAKSPSGGFWEMINTRRAQGNEIGFLLTSRGNGIRTQLNNPGVQQFEPSSTYGITDNTWHLITITVDVSSNQMKYYVDNNLVDTINFGAGSLTGQGNFVIGWDYAWSGGAEYFRGNIATVTVYNSVLSGSDVSINFNAVKSRFNR